MGAPILDLARSDDLLAGDFRDAYGTLGFGAVVNHGVDPALIEGVFAASRQFHALPRETKMAIALDRNHRGFIPIDSSTDRTTDLAEVTKPNQSESFIMLRETGPDDPDARAGVYLAGPNQWPVDAPGFREAVTAYHDALCDLGRRLVRLAARSVGAPADVFDAAFERPTTWLRLLRYPPRPPDAPDDLYGSAPHRDFGAITILAQDDAGGLQVMRPEGGWIDVPPTDGALVVNVGDMLSRWTNGRLKSTPHRVINRAPGPRYSVPFFFDPHARTVITPLRVCVDPGETAAEPILFEDFLRDQLGATYDAHGAG
jgi:isopenicillin N synthase-like dioxygenase